MRVEGDRIIFDNLVEAGNISDEGNQPVQIKCVEAFSQSNAKGGLYRPKSIDDLRERADLAGERFATLFQ